MQAYIQQNELLAVLVEEVGEIGKALQGEGNLRDELIQVASVCVKWLELKDPAE
jgi:NTP pyrophosphatase (non-canonical NTP hydrolase)